MNIKFKEMSKFHIETEISKRVFIFPKDKVLKIGHIVKYIVM
jgi:hypothetical protein